MPAIRRAFTLAAEEAPLAPSAIAHYKRRSRTQPAIGSTMRARTPAPAVFLATATLACFFLFGQACNPEEKQRGCKIFNSECLCGYGCKTEFKYRTRPDCLNALREENTNGCIRRPCVRGTCIQTMQDPGFRCKCEGTGYYGRHCERACPTNPSRGLVIPHECVII